tara:strand:+ start:1993 stop:2910 length:918 start_codon:yes stop_codon:yes gene_type:complete
MSFVNKDSSQFIQPKIDSKEGVRCQNGGGHDYDSDFSSHSGYGYTKTGATLAKQLKGSYAPITRNRQTNMCGGMKKSLKPSEMKRLSTDEIPGMIDGEDFANLVKDSIRGVNAIQTSTPLIEAIRSPFEGWKTKLRQDIILNDKKHITPDSFKKSETKDYQLIESLPPNIFKPITAPINFQHHYTSLNFYELAKKFPEYHNTGKLFLKVHPTQKEPIPVLYFKASDPLGIEKNKLKKDVGDIRKLLNEQDNKRTGGRKTRRRRRRKKQRKRKTRRRRSHRKGSKSRKSRRRNKRTMKRKRRKRRK